MYHKFQGFLHLNLPLTKYDYTHKLNDWLAAKIAESLKKKIKMKMKKLIIVCLLGYSGFFFTSCGSKPQNNESAVTEESAAADESADEDANPSYDPNRGEGKYTEVAVGEKLDGPMAKGGEKVYDVKCSSCHKLTDERLVGPGWKGVTTRRTPVWIMNFITNTDVNIDKDPEVQAQLELCLVRMPNQSLSDDESRNLLEFMRKNDGVK